MNGLFKDTLAELLDKKTVYLFAIITFLAIVLTFFTGDIGMTIDGSGQEIGLEELGIEIDKPLLQGSKGLMSLLLFLTILMTAGILPNMFIKGRADYFLSKPLSRSSLILKKFFSIWIVYGALISICGLLCYVTGAVVHSIFNNMIFMIIGFTLIELFIWLTISFFVGITSGKTVSVITSVFLLWLFQYLLSWLHSSQLILEQFGYKAVSKVIDYFYYFIPKLSELSELVENAITQPSLLNSYIVYSSVGFGAGLLFLTIYLFKRKNY